MKKILIACTTFIGLLIFQQNLYADTVVDHSITSLINNFHDPDNQHCSEPNNFKWCLNTLSSGQRDNLGYWNVANNIELLSNYIASHPNNTKMMQMITPIIKESLNYDPITVNDFNDDRLWWVLAYLNVYDIYKKLNLPDADLYYSAARKAFDTMNNTQVDNVCGGGIYWNGSKDYKNAITNELFFTAAAKLAYINNINRNPTEAKAYLKIAQQQWSWLSNKHNGQYLITNNLVNDGFNIKTNAQGDKACYATNTGTQLWTYNQGVLLGGIGYLAKDLTLIKHDKKLANNTLQAGINIANTVIQDPHFVNPYTQVLYENLCELSVNGQCNNDQTQFKGIFIRYLSYFTNLLPKTKKYNTDKISYRKFISLNAASIIDTYYNKSSEEPLYGLHWNNNLGYKSSYNPTNASTDISAIDVLLANRS